MKKVEDSILDAYIATAHWATTRDGYESVVTLYNYYGQAFRGRTRQETDAEVRLHFFDEDRGRLEAHHDRCATGATLHLEIGKLRPGFRGMVAAQMIPDGRMPRLTAKPGEASRPIATSYFMLYRKPGGYQDFSHELFPLRKAPSARTEEWATTVYFRERITPSIVVMNNCLPNSEGSQVTVRLLDARSRPIGEEKKITLSPSGSRLLRLRELFGEQGESVEARIVVVQGKNIEQPMSVHEHASGDFNIHHF